MKSPVLMDSPCWAITAYFNPVGYSSRLANYRTFRKSTEIPLLTVEWSVNGHFELSESDAEILIQVSSPDLMWQKERLLNIGLRELPKSVDSVVWLDCDLVFRRPDWPEAVVRELEKYPIVQLFSRCLFPGPNEPVAANRPAPTEDAVESLVYLSRQPGTEVARFERLWGHPPKQKPKRRRLSGFAWAARREILERHGLYDACIFGAGDRAFACAAFGEHRRADEAWLRTSEQRRHYYEWADPLAAEVAGRVGLVEGDLVHLWHGMIENRGYRVRHLEAERCGFDPATDIEIDPELGLDPATLGLDRRRKVHVVLAADLVGAGW